MDINTKNIVSIIFLGALGSGLWNLAGEPTAGFIYNGISSAGGWFALVYGNFMNSGVGSGGWDDRGSVLFVLTILWTISIVAVRYYIFKFKNSYVKLVFTIAFFLFAAVFSYKALYSHKVTLYFDKNIEILAPYVENSEVLKSRSLYRQIDNLATFNKAQENISSLSAKINIELPKFSL